jgi:hypothetical protein
MSESFRPSKQFLIRGAIAIGIVAVILIVQTGWFQRIFTSKKAIPATKTVTSTLGAITTKDCNGNGIPDWEESLWGLDPCVLYTNGQSNADIIKQKQEALGVSSAATSAPTNQTDAIAQQLFSITTALSENQDVDDATLQKIAEQLGSSVSVTSVSDKYYLRDIHTVPTTAKSLTAYDSTVVSLIGKTDITGDDIQIIIQAAQTGDYSQLPQLTPIGQSYDALAKQLTAVPVPIGVAEYDLDLINGLSGMATSFSYLTQMSDNGTQALVGIALYKVDNNRAATAIINLRAYLVKYGILSS